VSNAAEKMKASSPTADISEDSGAYCGANAIELSRNIRKLDPNEKTPALTDRSERRLGQRLTANSIVV